MRGSAGLVIEKKEHLVRLYKLSRVHLFSYLNLKRQTSALQHNKLQDLFWIDEVVDIAMTNIQDQSVGYTS